MKITALSLVLLAAALAAAFAISQRPFANAYFEFGVDRPYTGVVEDWPAPLLAFQGHTYLLAGTGKFGADPLTQGQPARFAALSGSLIRRGSVEMLQVAPDSFRPLPGTPSSLPWQHMGDVTLTGEIVDTKCWLGVMNPGQGKVHRACAARCLAGGIPPGLAIGERLIFLTGSDGRRIGRQLAPFAGERLTLTGRLLRRDCVEVLRTEPPSRHPE